MMTTPLLTIKDLKVTITQDQQAVYPVRGISLDIYPQETVAIVGESGSGKSVFVRTILGLDQKNRRIEGDIRFNNQSLLTHSQTTWQAIRGKKIAMIFQNAMTVLNPALTIGHQLIETIRQHHTITKAAAKQKAIQLLTDCELDNVDLRMKQYPHEFSGGQKQRIAIAIALCGEPELLIADEPTTALDVRIQDKIIKLIKKFQQKIGFSIIFITHDLGIVSGVADRVAVMYAGRLVEHGSKRDIFYNPQHPYTWALLESIPDIHSNQTLLSIPGVPPNLSKKIKGDAFAPRSKYALKIDYEQQPPFFQVNPHHYAATWLLHPKAPQVELSDNIKQRKEIFRSLEKEGSE